MANAECLLEEVPDQAKLQKGIAVHTRARCKALHICSAERIDDQFVKGLLDAEKIVADVQLAADKSGFDATARPGMIVTL